MSESNATLPGIVIKRGQDIVRCPNSENMDDRLQYSNLNKDQFIIYSRECLKEKLGTYIDKSNLGISREFNGFMESIPEVLIDFSTEESRRLLLKYLDSNMSLRFATTIDRESVYGCIMDLYTKDPR